MRQYETFELHFSGENPTGGYAGIPLAASFSNGEETTCVRGFYNGDGDYVIRFLPQKTGTYSWKVTGLFEAEGQEPCTESSGRHGMVKAVDTHFSYEDGTPFIPVGTTVYALISQEDELVEKTLRSLSGAPFNKIRMCVFPKSYRYNENEPPLYPFERTDGAWDTDRPCIAFWKRFENILKRLSDMGIEVDLILFHPYDRWGFNSLSQRENLQYLEYLLRRLSAFPGIWWSLANEYDLAMDHKSMEDWEEIEEYVASGDPYGHLLSNHNCFAFWDASRKNITHASIQTKALTLVPDLIRQLGKPVIIDECCYEGDIPEFWGCISGREMTRRFWRCAASGGFCTHGETFLSDDDVLWWAKGGVLRGESPERIAFLKDILYSIPGALHPCHEDISALDDLPEKEKEAALQEMPEDIRNMVPLFLKSIRRMPETVRVLHLAGEHTWTAQNRDAFLRYYDLQCRRTDTITLPEDRRYRVWVIDTWNMKRELVADEVSGSVEIELPGREDMAVLAM